MEFNKTKGFCNGLYVRNGGCEMVFHSLKHIHSEVTMDNCKKCSCPLARTHRQQYSDEKRGALN